MTNIIIEKAEDIFTFFNAYRKSTRFQFRGQSNKDWKLIPKAGRAPFASISDQEIFKHWKRRAVSYTDSKGLTDMELLSIAQHTGLPTRLLDWSFNPLIALFFACSEQYESDGAIFIYRAKSYKALTDFPNPFEDNNVPIMMLQPHSTHSRISNQFGYFTLHNKPSIEVDEIKLRIDKIIIPKDIKKEILIIINQLGVNNMTIFPDLDGLSKHMCWFYENYKYWTHDAWEMSPPEG